MSPKGALAVLVGFSAGIWGSVSAMRKMRSLERAKHWPTTRGKILESLLFHDPAKKATHFSVKYEFIVGEKITGFTPRLSGDWFWNNRAQAAFVARYTPGQEVDVFYDPRDAYRNCLDRADRSGVGALWLIALAGAVLASLFVWLDETR